MTARGKIVGGVVVLDDPGVIPEGTEVMVEVVPRRGNDQDSLSTLLLRHAGKGKDLPPDLAERHDHYAHGRPLP
jgi:hypothetical protein